MQSKQPTMARKLAALPEDASIEVLESVVKRFLVQKRSGGGKPVVGGSRPQQDHQQSSILLQNEGGETMRTDLVGRRPWGHGGSQGRATLASIPSHKLGTRSRGHGGQSRVSFLSNVSEMREKNLLFFP